MSVVSGPPCVVHRARVWIRLAGYSLSEDSVAIADAWLTSRCGSLSPRLGAHVVSEAEAVLRADLRATVRAASRYGCDVPLPNCDTRA